MTTDTIPPPFRKQALLKFEIDPALLHNRVCRMAGLDFGIHGKIPLCERTVPNDLLARPLHHQSNQVDRQQMGRVVGVEEPLGNPPAEAGPQKNQLLTRG
jgi:hypothetical protein